MISDDLKFMLAFPPEREGFTYILYQHPYTKLYQWINDIEFAELFQMIQIFPAPASVGFGLVSFGIAPFGR